MGQTLVDEPTSGDELGDAERVKAGHCLVEVPHRLLSDGIEPAEVSVAVRLDFVRDEQDLCLGIHMRAPTHVVAYRVEKLIVGDAPLMPQDLRTHSSLSRLIALS
ncbi:MAG: hypothetical protein HW416_589 [Chloroflexi bacterium]|nr:hypothetical protein [Chloroflexota bacterium]